MSTSVEQQQPPATTNGELLEQQTAGSNGGFTPPPPRPKHVNPEELLDRKRKEEEEAARLQQQQQQGETNNTNGEQQQSTTATKQAQNEHPTEQDLNATDSTVENRAAATVSGSVMSATAATEENNNSMSSTETAALATTSEDQSQQQPAPAVVELTEEEREAQRKKQEEEEEEERRKQQEIEFNTQRTELETAESTARQAIENEEEPNAFQTEIVQAEKADQQAYAQRLRDELNKVESSAEIRRREAAKLVTALGEIRRHFAIDQERVNLTKQYTDIALKCRRFDEWMNERYMASPKVTRHDRTALISVEEMERMHTQRDELLGELERLADNMAGLRHLVMDASELVDEDGEEYEQQQQQLIQQQQQQQANGALAIKDGEQHVEFAEQQDENQSEPHNLTGRSHTAASVQSATSATHRADDAIVMQRGLLFKTKELENKKRELQADISHREKESEVKLTRANRTTKASAAAMSGLNKELFRLEEAVNAHFRVLRTSYQSFKTEFPQLYEFDAFTQDGPRKKKEHPKAITENTNQQQIENNNSNSRRSSIQSNVSQNSNNNNTKVGRIANVAHTVSQAQDRAAAKNKPSSAAEQKAAAAASLAREAARLVSPTMHERVQRAATDSKREKEQRQKSVVDRAREDASEEARSQRRLEREHLRSSELPGKEKVRQKEAEEKAKMLGRKTFMRA